MTQKIENIFHPTDLSVASDIAFIHALKLALMGRCGLTVMHVAGKHEHIHRDSFPSVRRRLEQWDVLPPGSGTEAVSELGVKVHKIMSKAEDPVRACQQYMETHSTGLVVLVVHQQGDHMRWLHHVVGKPIVRNAGEKALIIPYGVAGFVNPQDGSLSLGSILIPIDRQPYPQAAIDAVHVLTGMLGLITGVITLLYVGNESEAPTVTLPADSEWRWDRVCQPGNVVDVILQTAAVRHCDLVVMATEGRHGFFDALRGSTTERVLQQVNCPLLTVPV